jgi:FKBP-type peptidyl-prolyl cis-trans isomerase FkpA
MNKTLPVLALALLLGACSETEAPVVAADDATGAFSSDDDRTLYAIGIALGSQLTEFGFTEAETEFVAEGIRDGALDAPPQVDMDIYGPRIQTFVEERMRASQDADLARLTEDLEREKAASAEFAARIAAEPGAQTSVSGLVFVSITEGTGETPDALDTVTVHYHGTFADGTVFDSSVDRGTPATFPLSGVIACWTEGVQKIRVGGKARLLCPSDIAYGDDGRSGIPGGAALLFEVELLGIE